AEDPMPNLRALMAQGVSGIARVQSFGGGTHLAESALISGLHTNPYIPHKMDSLAWQLKPLGYQSTAVHTYWGWFYDRHKHMKDLGFDRFIPLEAMTGRPDFIPYAGDRLLYDQILGVLSESQSPHFIYAATMQAHGGYAYPARYDTPVQSVPLPPDAERELQNFLWQLTSADAALGDFVRGLQHLEEPFVLIFLADHFPSLPLTLAAAGIDKEDERLYEMPYCVITNTGTALPEFGMLEDTQLSALALGALGLPETIYQRYADDEQAFNLLTYDALYGMQYARDRITQGDDNAAYLFGREPIISRALVNGNELTLIGTDLTWRTVIQCGRAYELVLLDTNGQTATACVTDAMAAEMRLSQARILFVDDAERPFHETTFHAVFSED
ncbi:MAG: LTA synthase family protein, partial [Clostridia bacterium]|nr:LTA synthase family protein [Clostridia bacterium]